MQLLGPSRGEQIYAFPVGGDSFIYEYSFFGPVEVCWAHEPHYEWLALLPIVGRAQFHHHIKSTNIHPKYNGIM
jgi:hypothetical protein